jgi:hypothetical protein
MNVEAHACTVHTSLCGPHSPCSIRPMKSNYMAGPTAAILSGASASRTVLLALAAHVLHTTCRVSSSCINSVNVSQLCLVARVETESVVHRIGVTTLNVICSETGPAGSCWIFLATHDRSVIWPRPIINPNATNLAYPRSLLRIFKPTVLSTEADLRQLKLFHSAVVIHCRGCAVIFRRE